MNQQSAVLPFITLLSALMCLVVIQAQMPGSGNNLLFDGVNDHVIIPDNNAINNGDFTIEFWMSPSSASWEGALLDMTPVSANNAGDKYFFVDGRQNRIRFYFESANDADVQVRVNYNFVPGEWYHIACVGGFNRSDRHRLYVNGVQVGFSNTNTNGKPNTLANNIFVGINQSAYIVDEGGFPGNIEELRIWSQERSESQIRAGMCRKMIGNESKLNRYYRFDEKTGAILEDATNNDDGTLQNFNLPSAWVTSAAPIGDASVSQYSVNTSTNLSISSPAGDEFTMDISSYTNAPSSIHVYRVDTVPNVNQPPTGLNQISQYAYYGAKAFGGRNVVYTAVYNYNGHPGINDENDLRLASRASNAGASWDFTSAALNTTANTLTLTGQTGTEFILGTVGSGPLPVELLSFTANIEGNGVVLKWQTASELNNDHFIIERAEDAANWQPIGRVEGAGNSSSLLNYSLFDEDPIRGVSYYRLKQIDHDGSSSYSNIQAVTISEKHEILAYPIPCSDMLYLDLGESEEFNLFDSSGRSVLSKIIASPEDAGVIGLNVSQLANGLYFVKSKSAFLRVLKR